MRLAAYLLSIFLIAGSGCENSDDLNVPLALLHYDGVNASAPIFNAGTNQVAVKFRSDRVAQYNQGNLSEIRFFMANRPESCQLDIYQGTADNNMPGARIYSADLSSQVSAGAWNRYILDQSLTIDNDDLWITLTFDHPASLPIIGCDLGPQVANGALILNGSGTVWEAYPSANINWNIRAGFQTTQ
jgi:hypothetical protein